MGLNVNFKVQEMPNSNGIWIYDTTGVYHITNNPNGWGGVNPFVNNVTSCTVTVTRPDPTTLEISTDPTMQFTIVGSPLPNVIGNRLEILNTSLGLSSDELLIDGNYRISVNVQGVFSSVNFNQTYTTERCFYSQLRCCAEKATSDADISDCGCAPCREKLFKTMLINLGVDGVVSNNNCGKPNKALEILKTATGLCLNEDCKGCN